MNNKLKIGYLSFCDNKGGAARGAMRLHQGFLAKGIDSRLIVRRKYSEDASVVQYNVPLTEKQQKFNTFLASDIYPKLRAQSDTYASFNLRYTGIDEFINAQNFDLIIMHWIGGDTISIKELARIKVPIIWRLADEWAFNGSLHYTNQDQGWKDGYQKESLLTDANAFVWNRKLKHWKNFNCHFVCGSTWLTNQVKKSWLFKNYHADTIPSSLELDIFKPRQVNELSSLMNVNPNKRYIVYGAANSTNDTRKGFDLLLNALTFLKERLVGNDVELIVFGNSESNKPASALKVHYLGNLHSDSLLSEIYSVGNVCVVPSRVDNLPFAALEALACGTPIVGFNVGGLPDIVINDYLGELVEAFNCKALGAALFRVLDRNKNNMMQADCRNYAVQEYSVETQTNRYLDKIDLILNEAKNEK